MNDQLHFTELLKRLDSACERMNAGLAAIALVLALMVLIMGVFRASQETISLGAAAENVGLPFASGISAAPWTYY